MSNSALVVHETLANGQHRITVHAGGVPIVGEWAAYHQLASNGSMLANSGSFEALPLGVFTTRVVPHQQLA